MASPELTPDAVPLSGRPHVLYRMFDSDGLLLYVGITADMTERIRGHRDDKAWWAEVANIRLEHFPDRTSVLLAERATVEAEKPKYNVRLTRPVWPSRSVCVGDKPWSMFHHSTAPAGMTKYDVLREVIDWTNADPELWAVVRKIAEQRGETMRGVVLGELRRYANRHKDLLDTDDTQR